MGGREGSQRIIGEWAKRATVKEGQLNKCMQRSLALIKYHRSKYTYFSSLRPPRTRAGHRKYDAPH